MTTTTITPLQTVATDALRYFEVAERTDGTRYDRLTDDAPEWLRDAVRAAHGDELPNDWRYGIACSAVAAIARGELTECDTSLYEFADSATDIYTADLLRWLAAVPSRVNYVEMAREEYGKTGEFDDELMRAQHTAISDVAHAIVWALRDHTDAQ